MSAPITGSASSQLSATWLPRSAWEAGVTEVTRPPGAYASTHSRKKSVSARDLARTSSIPTPSQTSRDASSASMDRMSGVPTLPRTAPSAGVYPGVIANGSACDVHPGRGESKAV